MVRAKKVPTPKAVQQQNNDIWATYGVHLESTMLDWDPDAQAFTNLVFEILSEGQSITIRPGSGGKSLGVQIWTWENKRPYIWFNEFEELNQWVQERRAAFEAFKATKAE